MHDKLLSALSAISESEQYSVFFNFVKEKKYSEALLLGSKSSKPEDKTYQELLAVLLHYAHSIDLDLNIKETMSRVNTRNSIVPKDDVNFGTPLYYAVLNQNAMLYCSLMNAGATQGALLLEQWQGLVREKIIATWLKMPNTYFAQARQIKTLRDELSSKETQYTQDQRDKKNIVYALAIIRHLIAHYSDLSAYSELAQIYFTALAKNFLIELAVISSDLSTKLREEYTSQLGAVGWFTLEQLGGVLKPQGLEQIRYEIPVFTFEQKPGDTQGLEERSTIDMSAGHYFADEYRNHDRLVEAVIPTALKDMPALNTFFTSIATHLFSSQKPPVESVALPHILRINRYFNEVHYLADLLNLLHCSTELRIESKSENISTKKGFDLSTKLGKHAFLRRLQLIGEALTAKNSDFIFFDKTIDYSALINLRDYISHQDRSYNYKLINELLHNETQLTHIINELHDLIQRVEQFMACRQSLYGVYEGNPTKYWGNVVSAEQAKPEPIKKNQSLKEEKVPERIISVERETTFLDALDKAAQYITINSDALEQTKADYKNIFSGSVNPPKKPRLGALFAPFAVLKKQELASEVYKTLKAIHDELLKGPPKKSESEREAARKTKVVEDQQHKIQQEKLFQGIETIRGLVRTRTIYQRAASSISLSPVTQAQSIIDAIDNMKEFLIHANYLDANLAYDTMNEWDLYNERHNRPTLVDLLLSNPHLNAALEYNAGQLLQQIDTFRNDEKAKLCTGLQEKYGELRTVRNYLAHDNPLIESYDQAFNLHSVHAGAKQKLIAPYFIYCICTMRADIQKIKLAIEETPVETAVTDEIAGSTRVARQQFGLFASQTPDSATNTTARSPRP